jgi:undecaprenyl phosphate-alpha-L-ara4N flippase subunit ArnE
MNRTHSNKTILLLFIPVLIMAAGQVSAKTGSMILASSGSFHLNIYLVMSYLFLILRGFIWIFIIRQVDLSTAYPVMSINYVIILIISAIFFDENLTPFNISGSILITSGIFILMYDSLTEKRDTA